MKGLYVKDTGLYVVSMESLCCHTQIFFLLGHRPYTVAISYTNLIIQQCLIRHTNARKLKHTSQLKYTYLATVPETNMTPENNPCKSRLLLERNISGAMLLVVSVKKPLAFEPCYLLKAIWLWSNKFARKQGWNLTCSFIHCEVSCNTGDSLTHRIHGTGIFTYIYTQKT